MTPHLLPEGVEPGRVTQKDVAERAGVSSAMVSYVVNGGPRAVAPATRARVLRAVEELGYKPNRHARGLARGEDHPTREIGLVVGGSSAIIERVFYAQVLAGIFDEARRAGRRVRFLHFWEDLADPVLFNEHIHPQEASGIILLAADLARTDPGHSARIEAIRARVGRVACVDSMVAGLPTVSFDRARAAALVMEHLLGLGHRRVAFVGNTGRRAGAYRQILSAAGLPERPGYLVHPGPHNSSEEGFRGVQALLRLPEPPTAVFAASDEVAVGVLAALQGAGLRVPDDVSVASVDDEPVARFLHPALTTVDVPAAEIGRLAVGALDNDGLFRAPGTMIQVETRLVVRASTGAPPTG